MVSVQLGFCCAFKKSIHPDARLTLTKPPRSPDLPSVTNQLDDDYDFCDRETFNKRIRQESPVGFPAINQHCPTPQHQPASTVNNNYYYNFNVNPADLTLAYNAAFATPFQYAQYASSNIQDGLLHNVKIQGIRKRKCRECDNYGCKGSNNRNKCENKKA